MIRRALIHFVCFCTVFLSTASLVHIGIGSTIDLSAMGRSQKLVLAEMWQGQVNVYAFGTSRLHQGFVPEAFDGAIGNDLHVVSLNLALLAGSQVEQRMMARHVLGQFQPMAGVPCLALLELNAGLNFPVIDVYRPQNINLFHPRAVNIYTPDALQFVAGFSDHSVGLMSRVGRLGVAAITAVGNSLNFGMLSGVIQQHLPALPEKRADGSYDTSRGVQIFDSYDQSTEEVRTIFLAAPLTPHIVSREFMPGHLHLLRDVFATNPYVRLAYVVTPTTEDMQTAYTYPAYVSVDGLEVPVFNLARPDLYPELYRPENWRDHGHLNPRGADIFTKILAAETRAWLQNHPEAAACQLRRN